ncbi:hypothetical protein [Microbacterium sp. 179-I 3D4 NHS]|uniref:hypothetical protein n=1 Tax=Microbacterium sp. 179-I 3D4 NHS TaxID=3142381 RepID=UPI0039A3BF40
MSNEKKTRKSRGAAVLLAGLMIAGGAVALPQAASAAETYKTCGGDGYSCSTTVTAKQTTISFKVVDTRRTPNGQKYTVKTGSGSTICSGTVTVNGGGKTCSLFGYKGKVTVSVAKGWSTGSQLKVSY